MSVITGPIEKYVPPLGALCANIAARTGEPCLTDVVMTIGSGGALKRHFDPFDVVVLQVQGSKRWLIYESPVMHPLKDMPKPAEPESAVLFDETLEPGDLLFMPGGYWHHCENGPDLSLHLAVGIAARTGWHAMKGLLEELLGDEMARTPLTRFRSVEEKAAHEAALKALLIEKIGQMSLQEMAAKSRKKRDTPSDDH